MNNYWLDKWNERYRNEEYAYGTEPNAFFKYHIDNMPVGKILLPAEGEGRNATYAAKKGWDVHAFDISIEGKHKAEQLSRSHKVNIKYEVGDLYDLPYEERSFDVIALIFAHFPAEIRSDYHNYLSKLLKTEGTIIFEAFSKDHLQFRQKNPSVGGPADISNLFSEGELRSYFHNYIFNQLDSKELYLEEGIYHQGLGYVIQCVAVKKS